jgi:hypothetical protein
LRFSCMGLYAVNRAVWEPGHLTREAAGYPRHRRIPPAHLMSRLVPGAVDFPKGAKGWSIPAVERIAPQIGSPW